MDSLPTELSGKPRVVKSQKQLKQLSTAQYTRVPEPHFEYFRPVLVSQQVKTLPTKAGDIRDVVSTPGLGRSPKISLGRMTTAIQGKKGMATSSSTWTEVPMGL